MPEEAKRIGRLRDALEQHLMASIPELKRNGDGDCRLPGNTSLTFPGVEADLLIANLPGIALSTGSACTSGAMKASYILRAIGLSEEDAFSTIRVGLGRFTTEEEIRQAGEAIGEAYEWVMG